MIILYFSNAEVGLVMLYLKNTRIVEVFICNKHLIHKFGSHCYFLNLIFFFLPDESWSMHTKTNVDMASRVHNLYPFMTHVMEDFV